jgi:hypothetical protein
MKIQFAAMLLLISVLNPASAEPSYYLIPTYENAGEKTIDFKLWSVKIPNDPRATAPHIGFGYGVTREWYSELAVGYLHTPETGTQQSDLNWQNDYLLTRGQYPFDLAIHTNVTKYRTLDPERRAEYFGEYRGVNVEFGPVLQTDIGRVQLNANLLFDRTYRSESPSRMQMKYQWQAKYRFFQQLHLGLQGFGELGDWDHWAPRSQQSHRAGPVISGVMPMGQQALKYEASFLFGSIIAEQAKTLSMRVQYVF